MTDLEPGTKVRLTKTVTEEMLTTGDKVLLGSKGEEFEISRIFPDLVTPYELNGMFNVADDEFEVIE